MGQFIDQRQLWAACQQGIDIHFRQPDAAVFDLPSREEFQAGHQRLSFSAAMRLHIADHHINPRGLALMGRRQHGIGLAHASSIAQKNLQFAPRAGRFFRLNASQQLIGVRTTMVFGHKSV